MRLKKFSAQEIFGSQNFSGTSINYDTSAVYVTSDQCGIMNIYRYPLDGGERTKLTNSATDAMIVVSCFPDDERVLFSSDKGGNELNHIFVLEANGEISELTCGNNLKAKFLGWNEANKSFYIMTNERKGEKFDVYEYSTSNYARELVFRNDSVFLVEKISGNGRWISLVKMTTYIESDIYLLDLTSSEQNPVLITEHRGNVRHQSYTFSHDSKYFIYATNEFSEFKHAWRFNLLDGEKSEYCAADWDISSVDLSKDGKFRIIGINEDGLTRIQITNLLFNKTVRFESIPNGNIISLTISNDSQVVVLNINTDTSPTNIYSLDFMTGSMSKITESLSPLINESQLVSSQVKRYVSFDGTEIPGILYKPNFADVEHQVPALIWVHGGPGGQSRRGFRAEVQHLVSNGYAVFAVNNRGSSGYGKTFYNMDQRRHGEDDLLDIVYGKKFLLNFTWVQKDKIGIIGRSYGGFLTLAAMTFTNEFKVGIDIFGVSNWTRTISSIPPWMTFLRQAIYEKMGHPKEDALRHRDISPLFHAQKINKPILVVQGANDPRVLQIESDEIVAAVRKNNIPAEYLLFNDEGHGFQKKPNQIKASNTYLNFLGKYL